jgi:hypothetical protein
VHPQTAPFGGLGGLVPEAGPRYVATPNTSGVDHGFMPSLEQILRAAEALVADCRAAEAHDHQPVSLLETDLRGLTRPVASAPPVPPRPSAWRSPDRAAVPAGMLCLNANDAASRALLTARLAAPFRADSDDEAEIDADCRRPLCDAEANDERAACLRPRPNSSSDEDEDEDEDEVEKADLPAPRRYSDYLPQRPSYAPTSPVYEVPRDDGYSPASPPTRPRAPRT